MLSLPLNDVLSSPNAFSTKWPLLRICLEGGTPVQNLQLQWHWKMIWNKRLAQSQIRDETSDRTTEEQLRVTQEAHTHRKGLELLKIRFPFLIYTGCSSVKCDFDQFSEFLRDF